MTGVLTASLQTVRTGAASVREATQEAERQPVAGPPEGQPARAVRLAYTFSHAEIVEESDLIRGGVSVPLPGPAEAPRKPICLRVQLSKRQSLTLANNRRRLRVTFYLLFEQSGD